MRRVILCLTALLTACGGGPSPDAAEPPHPNVLFVLLDDVRFDDLGYTGHPFVQTLHFDRIAHEGMVFHNAFAATPLCSPNRASILTGHYAHKHGIIDNVDRSEQSHGLRTFPMLMQQAGYDTAFVGKWHMGVDDSARPGFDEWLSIRGQGRYFDPEVNDNGESKTIEGYASDIFSERAADFIRRPRNKPFLVYLSHKAVHPNIFQLADGSVEFMPEDHGFTPPKRMLHLYEGMKPPRRSSAKTYGRDKKALMRRIPGLPDLGPETATPDDVILNRLRMLTAADEGFAKVLRALEDTGTLDKTVVVLTSDHGYFYGEHGLFEERRLAYEEIARTPLAIRYPKVFKPGSESDAFVVSTDLAPTVLDLAGVSVPDDFHGRSLTPLASMTADRIPEGWRDSVLIEYYSDKVWPRLVKMGYQAVRTQEWKLIHYTELEGMDELYDLRHDPYEQKNLIDSPEAAPRKAQLQEELVKLLGETGGELARPF